MGCWESYRRRQATLIDELNGEFALALWDGRRRALVLARDLAGARPIYWTVLASGTVAFASEYKALLALPGFDFAVDREMLQQLQYMKHLPSTRTLFRAVHSRSAGCSRHADAGRRHPGSCASARPAAERES